MTLTIRRAVVGDAAAFAKLLSDPTIAAGLLQLPYPNEERWRTLLTEQDQPGKADIHLVAERDGEVLGSAGLMAVGTAIRRRHAMTLGIWIAGPAQGQGVGTALMAALCDYADRWLGSLRLELTVFADNDVAQRLYRNFGFEVEGRFKGYAMRNGRYEDALAMARFHPDPPLIVAAD